VRNEPRETSHVSFFPACAKSAHEGTPPSLAYHSATSSRPRKRPHHFEYDRESPWRHYRVFHSHNQGMVRPGSELAWVLLVWLTTLSHSASREFQLSLIITHRQRIVAHAPREALSSIEPARKNRGLAWAVGTIPPAFPSRRVRSRRRSSHWRSDGF